MADFRSFATWTQNWVPTQKNKENDTKSLGLSLGIFELYPIMDTQIPTLVSSLIQGQLQIWTEYSTLIFENLKLVEKSKKSF